MPRGSVKENHSRHLKLNQPYLSIHPLKEKTMKRLFVSTMVIISSLLVAPWGSMATQGAAAQSTAPATQAAQGPDKYGEQYNADPVLLKKAVGTADGVPQIALAAFYRAGLPVDQAHMDLAVKCWKDKIC